MEIGMFKALAIMGDIQDIRNRLDQEGPIKIIDGQGLVDAVEDVVGRKVSVTSLNGTLITGQIEGHIKKVDVDFSFNVGDL